ncbi:MAG: endolytic transglycosylase MltG [Oscillospiraceae bacterium]|nr:endolytic transglycosylase MltG [Oscillospiraceae bacterium]
MSHRTPDDDFDLPNFDDLMDGDTQGGNTEKDTARESESFVFDEDFFASGENKASGRKSSKDASSDIAAWADADPNQVDAVLSALNHQGKDSAKGQKPAGRQGADRKKAKEPDEFQVSAVLSALKDFQREVKGKAPDDEEKQRQNTSERRGNKKETASADLVESKPQYKPVWMERKKKDKPAKPQKQEPLERVTPTIGRNLRADQMLVYDSELDDIDYTDEEDLPEARDYMPIRFRRYGRVGVAGGILYALFVISVSIVLACAAWMMASDVLALNKEEVSAVVTIEAYEPTDEDTLNEEGNAVNEDGEEIQVDIAQVATVLKNAGIIEYKWLFKLYSQFSSADTKIDPGTYDVSTELDYRALVTTMQFGSGSQEVTRVTFPEGYTLSQIFALLEENNICEVEELEEAAANYDFDYDFLADLELGDANRLEGYLFPDTYDFYQGESATVAINRFLRNTSNKLTEEMEEQAASMGYTMHDIIIIASLIEKEAGSDEERATIASVIYNRLNAGWTLGLDSSINYILGSSTFELTSDDLAIDSPYNTYLYAGLPAGPICNPGLASIEAALNPESTNYWYWYSYETDSGTWVTEFFSTSDEFNAFAAEHPYS